MGGIIKKPLFLIYGKPGVCKTSPHSGDWIPAFSELPIMLSIKLMGLPKKRHFNQKIAPPQKRYLIPERKHIPRMGKTYDRVPARYAPNFRKRGRDIGIRNMLEYFGGEHAIKRLRRKWKRC